MGGVQSGPHSFDEVNNVGRDALWVQERLRQKNSRVSKEGSGSRHEHPRGSGTSSSVREHKKLLKRTKSLAVISEENRAANNRVTNYYRLGEPALSDAFRRQQLIPRAKLIDRHSLKDRLSKSQQHLNGGSFEISNPRVLRRSRLTSDTYSVSDPQVSLPNLTAQNIRNNQNPDRLNILDWPESPIPRYRSVQNLDNVSGLVDIVDDDWSSEGNRSIDCIYTQVKRKRKEHRSLDSVLFEEDKELEYFNVLDLLPLSNVRLEFEERNGSYDNRNFEKIERNFEKNREPPSKIVYDKNEIEDLDEKVEEVIAEAVNDSKIKEINETTTTTTTKKKKKKKVKIFEGEKLDKEKAGEEFADEFLNKKLKKEFLILDSDEDKYRADVAVIRETEDSIIIEEAEDYKSIWISDSEETEEMSRRPQVLKVIDNEVTKRNRNSFIEIGDVVEAMNETTKGMDKGPTKSNEANDDDDDDDDDSKVKVIENPVKLEDEVRVVEEVKSYFETKFKENVERKADNTGGGKLGRIIKETTSIFGKACSVVKGSLGFEARSESSDLGLGSESGSDTRRRSMDEVDETEESSSSSSSSSSSENRSKLSRSKDTENNRSSLSRSLSCMDSVKNENAGPEFDHIRYKIMKSDLFSKNIFGSMKKEETFDGLMQYLQEYSFQDLLVDNNVVIIEPVRAETIERKSSTKCDKKLKNPSSCRIAGAIEKNNQSKTEGNNNVEKEAKISGKQSSLRKHFFYHPIRVNRELIDDELPDPDTVRNVRKMFEGSLKLKTPDCSFSRNSPTRKTVSMKDLRRIDESFESSDKTEESRSSSRARNLTRLFEKGEDKRSKVNKDEMESPRSDSKTRIIAQVFEARSGQTSPSDGCLSNDKIQQKGIKYLQNWDAGSVSSGVSSDYPDTDQGSGVQCTSSDEEEDENQDEDEIDNGPGHFVSQDILKKIRECGTSVTYYGGKVVDTFNSPLISPPIRGKMIRKIMRNEPRSKNHDQTSKDYVKFRLVKSNSCDSRLELTGKVVKESKGDDLKESDDKKSASKSDLRKFPIMENTNVETSATCMTNDEIVERKIKKEPPIVIGLEAKKEEIKEPQIFKADFKLGRLEETKCYANKFSNSAFNQWQINENIEEKKCKFGEIDFEEFQVLEDSLNSSYKKNF